MLRCSQGNWSSKTCLTLHTISFFVGYDFIGYKFHSQRPWFPIAAGPCFQQGTFNKTTS